MTLFSLQIHLSVFLLHYSKLLFPWASVVNCLYLYDVIVLILNFVDGCTSLSSARFRVFEQGVHILFTIVSQCLALCCERNITLKRNKMKISKGEKNHGYMKDPGHPLLQKEN